MSYLELAEKISATMAATRTRRLPRQNPCPAARLDADWRTTAAKVRERFRTQGVRASQGTLEAATWLALQLDQGWPERREMSEARAREVLALLQQGRAARISEDAEVVLWDATDG
jgi:hypothetical protein